MSGSQGASTASSSRCSRTESQKSLRPALCSIDLLAGAAAGRADPGQELIGLAFQSLKPVFPFQQIAGAPRESARVVRRLCVVTRR